MSTLCMFFMETGSGNSLATILLLVLLGCYLAWSVLRDYRLVQHWEYKIWDMRRGHDRKGIQYEIERMRDLGEDGWECYQVLVIPSDDPGIVHREYHFKRKRSVLMLGFKKPKTGSTTGVKAGLKKSAGD